MKRKKHLLERLKICWYVLTKSYYMYFGLDDDPFVFDEDDKFKELKKNALVCYEYIDKDYVFDTASGMQNLHDFTWYTIERYAHMQQQHNND